MQLEPKQKTELLIILLGFGEHFTENEKNDHADHNPFESRCLQNFEQDDREVEVFCIPAVGERFIYANHAFTVTDSERTRVKRIRVEALGGDSSASLIKKNGRSDRD